MPHPGGRPRKPRREELCPTCGEKGYTRIVASWNTKYKETTKNHYPRFRHDDRSKPDCYIDEIAATKQQSELAADHPLKEITDGIDTFYHWNKILSKMWGKLDQVVKTWELTDEENRRAREAINFARPYMNAFIIHLKMVMTELEYISRGQDMPEEQRKFFEEMNKNSTFLHLEEQDVNMMFEPLRQIILELDAKYGIPQRNKKQRDTKAKQRESAFGSDKWDLGI